MATLFRAVYAVRRSSYLRQKNALTKKAWGDAVQGLGKRKPTINS